jgi:uracil-DNA glycosylase family protein
MREIVIPPAFEGWRAAARSLLEEGASPETVSWREAAVAAPTAATGPGAPASSSAFRVPREFLELARSVAKGRDPSRWALLYSVLWRLQHGEHDLLGRRSDPEVARLVQLQGEAAPAASPPGSLFPDMPTVTLVPTAADTGGPSARPFVPATSSLEVLREAALACRGCDLYRDATQTVFGEGPADARLVFVGEQPGDQEDRRGRPFVGPAGEVFDRALAEAGLDRQSVYVTNAVKHFKFIVQRGGRRIHQTPRQIEIGACRPWLESELAVIRPELLVCLGATASKALLGPDFRLMKQRGQFLRGTPWAPRVMATLHPSAVLRGETPSAQESLYGMLLEDLRKVAQ